MRGGRNASARRRARRGIARVRSLTSARSRAHAPSNKHRAEPAHVYNASELESAPPLAIASAAITCPPDAPRWITSCSATSEATDAVAFFIIFG